MSAIIPRDETNDDCPIHGDTFITFGGKWMLCPSCAAAELLALRADLADAKTRAAAAEKGWHANEARLGKLQMVADALAEIVEYDTGDARHGLQSLAKARLAKYEKLKETK